MTTPQYPPPSGHRFNSPPNWPAPPAGWTPPPGWQPMPEWGPAPEGWQFWVPGDKGGTTSWMKRHKILTALAALFLIGTIGSIFDGGDTTANASRNETVASSSPSPAESPMAIPTANPLPTYTPPPSPPPSPAAKPKPKPFSAKSYKTVSSRQWALIVKNPAAHRGEKIALYGKVFQLDAATGDDTFLAETDAYKRPLDESWMYEHMIVAVATTRMLASVVEDDVLKMYVTIMDDFSYDTQAGGNTTVPLVKVDKLTVLGHDS